MSEHGQVSENSSHTAIVAILLHPNQFFRHVRQLRALIDRDLRAFLGCTYNLKALADYETGPGAKVSTTQATEAIAAARRFVAAIVGLLLVAPAPPSQTPDAQL